MLVRPPKKFWLVSQPSSKAASVGTPFSITFGDHAEDTTALTTYTWSSRNFAVGAADATRIVVAHIVSRQSTAITLNSVTIGGIAATKVVGFNDTGSNGAISELWQAAVPTGTTATVSAVMSAGALRAACAVWSVIGSNGSVPAGGAVTSNSTNGISQAGTITVPSGGGSIIAAGGVWNASGFSMTPTNFTTDLAATVISTTTEYCSGHDSSGTTGSRTYTLTYTQTTTHCGALFAAWGP